MPYILQTSSAFTTHSTADGSVVDPSNSGINFRSNFSSILAGTEIACVKKMNDYSRLFNIQLVAYTLTTAKLNPLTNFKNIMYTSFQLQGPTHKPNDCPFSYHLLN